MILVRLYGGLGNQMFQYAAARRLSLKHGVPIKLDLGWFDNIPSIDTPREYELDSLAIKAKAATTTQLQQFGQNPDSSRLQRKAAHARFKLGRFQRIEELGNLDTQPLLSAGPDSFVNGYWQNEAYFADVREQLLKELQPKKLSPSAKALMRQIGKSDSAILQVRRGDYVTDKNIRKTLTPTPMSYYRAAVKQLLKVTATAQLHIFLNSDDIEWCKQHFDWLPGKVSYIDLEGPNRAVEELFVASAAKHHIIANSSYGWWSAWLSAGGDDQLIIAPKKWHVKDPDKSRAIIPKSWKRL